jgi:Tfp pilus assembly protein PilO
MTITLAAGFVLLRQMLLPAWDELAAARTHLEALNADEQRLSRHHELRAKVAAALDQLPEKAWQDGSDEVVLSAFLRQIELLARYPNMTLISMKPHKPEGDATYRLYPVAVTLAGRLEDIVRFVDAAGRTDMVVGWEGFSMRAVQGGNVVECSFSLWRVCLSGGRNEVGQDTTADRDERTTHGS